jgi:hypothetical protein
MAPNRGSRGGRLARAIPQQSAIPGTASGARWKMANQTSWRCCSKSSRRRSFRITGPEPTLLFNVDHHCIHRCTREISLWFLRLRVEKSGDVEAACAAEEAFTEALMTEDSL